ncbi:MAG: hypothetical protein JST98_05870 [Bacteroidetes bacterium]|nr:hypothetical protein [Bacteroidota bacterium]
MLPAIPIADPAKAAMLFSRSISDDLLENREHLQQRNEQLAGTFRFSHLVTIRTDRTVLNEAIDELGNIRDECDQPGWDGHEALPVSYATYRKAIDFLEALPAELPMPEIVPENDGELAFEWRDERGQVLSVSLASNGRLTVLYMPDRMRTTLLWSKPELPNTLLKLIELFA